MNEHTNIDFKTYLIICTEYEGLVKVNKVEK